MLFAAGPYLGTTRLIPDIMMSPTIGMVGGWETRRETTTNRSDRLYAIVEELRAHAPRCPRAAEMAARFEVGVRTIERDQGDSQC